MLLNTALWALVFIALSAKAFQGGAGQQHMSVPPFHRNLLNEAIELPPVRRTCYDTHKSNSQGPTADHCFEDEISRKASTTTATNSSCNRSRHSNLVQEETVACPTWDCTQLSPVLLNMPSYKAVAVLGSRKRGVDNTTCVMPVKGSKSRSQDHGQFLSSKDTSFTPIVSLRKELVKGASPNNSSTRCIEDTEELNRLKASLTIQTKQLSTSVADNHSSSSYHETHPTLLRSSGAINIHSKRFPFDLRDTLPIRSDKKPVTSMPALGVISQTAVCAGADSVSAVATTADGEVGSGGQDSAPALCNTALPRGSSYFSLPDIMEKPSKLLCDAESMHHVPHEPVNSLASNLTWGSTAEANGCDDSELLQLKDNLEVLQMRIYLRTVEIGNQSKVLKNDQSKPTIMPPSPAVFSAVTEAEVHERAAAAENFVAFQQRQRQGLSKPTQRLSNAGSCDLSYVIDVDDASEADDDHGPPRPYSQSTNRGSQQVNSLLNSTSPCVAKGTGADMDIDRTSLYSSSSTHMKDGALAMMEMLATRPDVSISSPAEVVAARSGDVLSSKSILTIDLQDALHSRHGPTGIFFSAPYFRIVPKLNIAGVAQANASAVRAVFNEIRRAHVDGPLIWVNLRDEPLVYINDAAHVVRSRSDPLKPFIIPNVTGRSIEMIEDKLKQEVLREARENGGNISVRVEGKDGLMEDQWESAHPENVQTLVEVFRSLAREGSYNQLHYYRRPITQDIGPKPEDFDFVLSACLEEPKAMMVFNCQTGRGRTSAMMQIASIVRFYQMCLKDISADVRVLRGNTKTLTFRTIQKLISLFPDGKLHERRINILLDLTDSFYSMSDHISEAFASMDTNPEEAMMRLQQYAFFLVFSCYCEQHLWNYATKHSFTEWLHENVNMELLISSIRSKLDDQLKEEQINLTTASIKTTEEADAARIIRNRHGNVLSSGRILCSLPMKTKAFDAWALRQLAPGVPIFTCGRLGQHDRVALVREINNSFPGEKERPRKFHWLSLRAEPMVVVNDRSYTLTDFNSPATMVESGTTMHISWQAIEQIEDRLRRDVLLEAQEYNGCILLHDVNKEGDRTFERVKVCSARTPRSIMEDFVKTCNVMYHRVPIPFSGQMLATDIDPLLHFLSECDNNPFDIFVINDPEGTTRTSVALNMLTLHRASRLRELRSIQTSEGLAEVLRVDNSDKVVRTAHLSGAMLISSDGRDSLPPKIELQLASTICQMLTAGTLLNTVNAAIMLGGSGPNYNILHLLDEFKKRINVTGGNRPQCVLNALYYLRCYLLVLLSSLYLDEQGSYEISIPFSAWVAAHTEVNYIIKSLANRGEAALKYVPTENLMRADVSRRCGDVLTANFCLKADHFPGCQKKGLRPTLCGAPNFRKVDFVNVYGAAMPTLLGLHNIFALLGASDEALAVYPGQRNDRELFRGFAAPRLFDPSFYAEELRQPLRGSVVWVNLREEPILYVGDRPFVFRDLGAPYVNVELTGIQTSKIEQVEAQLKLDVLNEAMRYTGKFLVHDEVVPGELVGIWETANEGTVKTLCEVYAELEAKGFRCQMLRLPVTDEQSPAISDFDELVAALLPHITEHMDRRETLSFVFNCQMGRGRTTTGMVICCLLVGLVMPEYYDELQNNHGFNLLYRDDGASDLWNGNYEVIVQLKRVLPQGRQAKIRVDLVIASCSMMQNLRTTIESFAEAERSPDNSEAARARAHRAGVHYLIRYFNLIAFEVYLKENYDRMRRRMSITFEEWMRKRPELSSLAATAALH